MNKEFQDLCLQHDIAAVNHWPHQAIHPTQFKDDLESLYGAMNGALKANVSKSDRIKHMPKLDGTRLWLAVHKEHARRGSVGNRLAIVTSRGVSQLTCLSWTLLSLSTQLNSSAINGRIQKIASVRLWTMLWHYT